MISSFTNIDFAFHVQGPTENVTDLTISLNFIKSDWNILNLIVGMDQQQEIKKIIVCLIKKKNNNKEEEKKRK